MADQKEKAVLAYSGGLDTSCCIKWLQENKGVDVIAVVGDVGQEHEGLEKIKQKALKSGALDCLVVHRERLADLPELCGPLAERQVVILADTPAYEALDGRYPGALLQHADEHSYGTEFLAYRMSIRTVGSLDEAVEHIARYSSRHSEAVVSENAGTIREFQQRVDAACVYANVSTAFTDGAQFGLGAEIGISTQKLHARGPMALRELTTYKYLIDGDGQTRA